MTKPKTTTNAKHSRPSHAASKPQTSIGFKKLIHELKVPLIVFVGSVLLFSSSLTIFLVLLHVGNLLPKTVHASTGNISWRAFDGGADDPGSNYAEQYLNTGNVSGLKVLWESTTPSSADDSVVYEAGVNTASGLVNLVIVNTIAGNVVAYNALTGAKIWEADPPSTYTGQGTKSTPAIDPSGNYVYAYAVDGYIHKYNIATGAEVTGNGFPAQITLLPNNVEKGSSSLNIANGYLYMQTSGNDGDYGHYVGHVVAINLSTGVETVWNAECSNITQLLTSTSTASNYCANDQSGMWARPGVKVDPITGNVYAVTGNGTYNANSGGFGWGDTIVELTPNLSKVVDSYTPTSFASLQSNDLDLGSSAPVILPTQPNSNTPYLMVQAGKDDTIRLINRANLSGQGGPGHTGGELQSLSVSSQMREQPNVWVDGSNNTWVFASDSNGDLYAYKLVTTNGVSTLSQVYTENIGISSSPFIANGVLYFSGNNIEAFDPTTGNLLFNSSSLNVSLSEHWEAPIVVNGILYTPDYEGNLYALYVPGVSPTTAPGTGSAPSVAYSTLTANQYVHGSAAAINTTALANDSGSITSCALTANNVPVQTITSSPYNFMLNSLNYSDGNLALNTQCIDNQGDAGSKAINVVVNNGDLLNAGHVNLSDLSIMAAHYNQTDSNYSDGNITGQSTINSSDLNVLSTNWGWTAP